MKPFLFLIHFIASYLFGIGVVYFFTIAMYITKDFRYILVASLFSVIGILFFSYLYFRHVSYLNWRQRWEVIGVWVGLVLILDFGISFGINKTPLSELSFSGLYVYGLMFLALFVSAFLTSSEKLRFSEPNLISVADDSASK